MYPRHKTASLHENIKKGAYHTLVVDLDLAHGVEDVQGKDVVLIRDPKCKWCCLTENLIIASTPWDGAVDAILAASIWRIDMDLLG